MKSFFVVSFFYLIATVLATRRSLSTPPPPSRAQPPLKRANSGPYTNPAVQNAKDKEKKASQVREQHHLANKAVNREFGGVTRSYLEHIAQPGASHAQAYQKGYPLQHQAAATEAHRKELASAYETASKAAVDPARAMRNQLKANTVKLGTQYNNMRSEDIGHRIRADHLGGAAQELRDRIGSPAAAELSRDAQRSRLFRTLNHASTTATYQDYRYLRRNGGRDSDSSTSSGSASSDSE